MSREETVEAVTHSVEFRAEGIVRDSGNAVIGLTVTSILEGALVCVQVGSKLEGPAKGR